MQLIKIKPIRSSNQMYQTRDNAICTFKDNKLLLVIKGTKITPQHIKTHPKKITNTLKHKTKKKSVIE